MKILNNLDNLDNISDGDTYKRVTTDEKTIWNNKSDFSGSYNDLTDKPTIPTVNNATLTIQKNGTNVQTFTANQSTNATANITVPTNTNELTNGAGFITSSGSITGNAATASKLASAKTISLGTGAVSNAASFDGSGDVTIPVTNLKESYVTWGGKSQTTLSPIEMGCLDEFGHNKLAFLPASKITVEYTTDGGETWIDYGLTDAQKIAMVTTNSVTCLIGKGSASASAGTMTNDNCKNYKVRVTLNGIGSLYTICEKILLNMTTNGANGSQVLVEARTYTNYAAGNDTWRTCGTYTVAGWPGWNSIPYIATFGGANTWSDAEVRFTLSITSVNTSYSSCAAFLDFRMIGLNNWSTPSELARVGRLYTIDTDKNATFPAAITATSFNGNATSATKATNDSDGNAINTTYYKASNPNGYTSNAGTITGITMNGTSKGTSGVVDLGTVITDISGKQDAITSSNKLDYSLLTNTPTIPTVNNGALTIQKNGTTVATFTANQSTAATANITVPTKVSELTNDSGFITSYTDTKNTAGSTDNSSKLFLIGATSQAANPQTYSDDQVYTTSGVLTANRMTPNNGLLLNAAASYTTSTNSWLRFVTQTDNSKPWGCKLRIYTMSSSTTAISQQIDVSLISRNNSIIMYGVDSTRSTWSGNSGIYQLRAISPYNFSNGYYGGLELWLNSTTSRTITVYPLELENCTIESSLQTTAYNSTYHSNNTQSTCSNRIFGVGLQGFCDTSTNSYQLMVNYPYWKVTSTIAMSGYTLFGMKSDTTITPFSVYSSSQSSNTTSINTARVYNTTDGMDYTQGIMYSNSGAWWAKSATYTSGPTYSSSANDFRYTDNCLATYNETNFGMQWRNRVYLRGVIKSDKLFYLRPYDATPLVLKAYYNTSKACFYTTSTGTTVVPLSTAYTYYDINTSTYYKCTSTTSPGTFTAITDLSSQTKYQKAWTQSPADGTDSDGNQYVFWFVGYPYRNSSYEYGQYQINLAVKNPVYWFKDDVFQEYETGSTVSFTQSLTSGTKVGTLVIDGTGTDLYCSTDTNTKNTAGSTDTSSKIFLIGATSQAANPQTYSQDTAYVDTNGHLYSNSKQVVNLSDSQALTNKTYNGYTLAAACAKAVDTTVTSGSANLPTSGSVYTAVAAKQNIVLYGTTEPDSSTGSDGDVYIMIES